MLLNCVVNYMIIEDKIKKFLGKILKINPLKIKNDTNMNNTAQWDSIAYIRIILALEERFKIKLKNSENSKITSLMAIQKIFKKYDK